MQKMSVLATCFLYERSRKPNFSGLADLKNPVKKWLFRGVRCCSIMQKTLDNWMIELAFIIGPLYAEMGSGGQTLYLTPQMGGGCT